MDDAEELAHAVALAVGVFQPAADPADNEGPQIRRDVGAELDVPRDATIVAVVREEHVVMPRGDTIFEARDEVLAMVTPDSEDEVRRILTGG